MASIFAHALSGCAFSSVLKAPFKLALVGVVCTCLPDIDIISFSLGIPYSSPFGHRGMTHSILFAMFIAIICKMLFYNKTPWRSVESNIIIFFLFICTASHGLFDAMTSGGLGTGFFIPFSNERFFLPFRPILVSPIGASRFFSEWGYKVLISELIWIGIPSISIILFRKLGLIKVRLYPHLKE